MTRRPHPAFVDLTGQHIGRLTVERRAQNRANGNAAWWCVCNCGERIVVEGIRLRDAAKRGSAYSCPACRAKRPGTVQRSSHARCIDMTGRRIAQLEVLGRAPNNRGGEAMWCCRCLVCREREVLVPGNRLRNLEETGNTVYACDVCRPRSMSQRRGQSKSRPRGPNKLRLCAECGGLPHRVRGLRCGTCGRLRGEEPRGTTLEELAEARR